MYAFFLEEKVARPQKGALGANRTKHVCPIYQLFDVARLWGPVRRFHDLHARATRYQFIFALLKNYAPNIDWAKTYGSMKVYLNRSRTTRRPRKKIPKNVNTALDIFTAYVHIYTRTHARARSSYNVVQ